METLIPAKQKLWREITITLVLKIVLIYVLWWIFFSAPLDEHLTGSHVGDFLFGDPVGPSADTPPSSTVTPSTSPTKENSL